MELLILKNLMADLVYLKKVLPHLKKEYFESHSDKIIFRVIDNYIKKYSSQTLPTITVLKKSITDLTDISEHDFESIKERVKEISKEIKKTKNEVEDFKWLIDQTEDFCQNKALELAIMDSVDILDKKEDKNKIPELLKKALQVSFQDDLGICFFDEKDIEKRILSYQQKITKIPCKLTDLNAAFAGGIEEKTITVFLGGTHSGKTQVMRSMCKDMLELGSDCLYITLEMSEEKISQGIEANYLNIEINDICDSDLSNFAFDLKSKKNKGNLWIKEYPTRGASTTTIRNYIEELRIKKEFVPKVVFVDYINLLNSDLYDGNQEHLRVKSIVEELRGLGVETKSAMVSGTQTNRGGDNASDLSLKEIADSFGLSGTADGIVGIISTEELRAKGILVFKIIKNRFGGLIDIKFSVRAETEYSRVSNIKSNEMTELSN